MKDAINPQHYKAGKVECIEALESATIHKQGLEAVCVANVIKYLWRYESKGGLQDLLQENGITEKQFCNRMRNGWSFANATTLDSGGYTEEARKRHNKRDIAKHVKQSRAKRYR